MEKVLVALFAIALTFAIASLPALLLSFVWNNFVSQFAAVPHLSFWMAWGIIIVLRWIVGGAATTTTSS